MGCNGIALVILQWHREHADVGLKPDPQGTEESRLATLTQYLRPLDDAHALPLYQQLQRRLREAIENRILGPDDALPPERDLAEELSVSRITVRKAIDGLVEEGLLVRR